jgi:hypothetical protein
MPKQITIKRSGNVDLWLVRVDHHDVAFDGDTFTHDIDPGKHVIQWFVRGGVGSSYTIEVTQPPEAAFKTPLTVLDESEKHASVAWITVTP